jgi:hypothetical protein
LASCVPRRWEKAEAELPAEWAICRVTADAELDSHGVFFLADLSGDGGRARLPCVEPGFTDDDDACLDGGDIRLDSGALTSFSGGDNVRMS